MSKHHLRNIDLQEIRRYLQRCGWELKRTKGGHESWSKPGALRPIVLQTHKDPVPEPIAKQIMRHLGFDNNADFLEALRK